MPNISLGAAHGSATSGFDFRAKKPPSSTHVAKRTGMWDSAMGTEVVTSL